MIGTIPGGPCNFSCHFRRLTEKGLRGTNSPAAVALAGRVPRSRLTSTHAHTHQVSHAARAHRGHPHTTAGTCGPWMHASASRSSTSVCGLAHGQHTSHHGARASSAHPRSDHTLLLTAEAQSSLHRGCRRRSARAGLWRSSCAPRATLQKRRSGSAQAPRESCPRPRTRSPRARRSRK